MNPGIESIQVTDTFNTKNRTRTEGSFIQKTNEEQQDKFTQISDQQEKMSQIKNDEIK